MSNHFTCATDGCRQEGRLRRGMCQRCYFRWWRKNPPPPKSPDQRFWEKVQRSDGCWEWQGSRSTSGHGQLYWEGRVQPATHVALAVAGRRRPDGREACHRCDNPPCVNPAHLYWGTRQDNIDDAYARGQRAAGEGHASARLREGEVVEIRTRYAAGEEVAALAGEFNVTRPTIRSIVIGNKWKNAGGPITRRRPSRKAA